MNIRPLLDRVVLNRRLRRLALCGVLSSALLALIPGFAAADAPTQNADMRAQIHVPTRPTHALFEGAHGGQRAQVSYDPATRLVTIKLLAQDPQGYFVPNIRRENFAVYDNGVRQRNVTVQIEHTPVTMGILLEYGGHYRALNDALGNAVSMAANQFLDEIGQDDKIAIWTYGDKVDLLSDFSQGHDTLQDALRRLSAPPFSEVNLYDALLSTLKRMQGVSGRKALLLVSTGLDTFSKASFQDALDAARTADTPIYVIDLGPLLHWGTTVAFNEPPYARLNWQRAQSQLQELATASGGRLYEPTSSFDLPAAYDDLMENLRVRYVITYRPTGEPAGALTRTVRVALVDSRTGRPLRIVNEAGQMVRSRIFAYESYTVHAPLVVDGRPPLKPVGN